MDRTPAKNSVISVTIAAAVVLFASMLPWGAHRGAPTFPLGGFAFPEVDVTFIVAWSGTINPLGLSLPNWLVVVAAVAIAYLAWLKEMGVWEAPPALPLALAIYGFLHMIWLMVALDASGKGSIGIGSHLTTVACAGLIYATAIRGRAGRIGFAKRMGPADEMA